MGLILCLALFFSSLNLFNSYKENPTPQSNTKRIIKTGIFAYCRNPMYLAFVSFHFSMFLTFENVAYFLSALGLFFWINNFVIPIEQSFLKEKFGDVDTLDGLKVIIDEDSWVLIRKSNTENAIRISTESNSLEKVTNIDQEIKDLVKESYEQIK